MERCDRLVFLLGAVWPLYIHIYIYIIIILIIIIIITIIITIYIYKYTPVPFFSTNALFLFVCVGTNQPCIYIGILAVKGLGTGRHGRSP